MLEHWKQLLHLIDRLKESKVKNLKQGEHLYKH